MQPAWNFKETLSSTLPSRGDNIGHQRLERYSKDIATPDISQIKYALTTLQEHSILVEQHHFIFRKIYIYRN